MLAYTVGFGGSMIWFGSSAGVAITNKFPEGPQCCPLGKKGWHVAVAYVIGFFALLSDHGMGTCRYQQAQNRQLPGSGLPGCGKYGGRKHGGGTGTRIDKFP
ncbi:MAG: hypothetical protein MZV63_62315 [Marinilabiliales bacterium]|nr:hypothetical protein [Marinilabiliales bacterium]